MLHTSHSLFDLDLGFNEAANPDDRKDTDPYFQCQN